MSDVPEGYVDRMSKVATYAEFERVRKEFGRHAAPADPQPDWTVNQFRAARNLPAVAGGDVKSLFGGEA